jgi:serine-type D-Ala-D-Ala carboxypeptidase (penicillin-binding protein 5/6)
MKKILINILSLAILVGSIHLSFIYADEVDNQIPNMDAFSTTGVNSAAIKAISINAGAAIVMDTRSGRVLFEKNAHTRRAIASTTKIMTGIIAIENGNLEDTVTISKKAAGVWGSTIDLKVGQTFKLKELLYGLLLQSGNDAAIAIAEHIGGSVDAFLDMMNNKAAEIGAKDTSFRSPHGLDMAEHFSTAYDLALITKYALANPLFSKIVGTKSAYVGNRMMNNTNELLGVYPGADGVKTGYTGQAGRCLVTSATRNNMRIISVVLGSPTRTARALSSKTILDYAFGTYKTYTLLEAEQKIDSLQVIKGKEKFVTIKAVNQISIPLTSEEKNSLQTVIDLPVNVTAPIEAGIEIGSIKYRLNGKVFAQTPLKTGEKVLHKNVLDYIGEIFEMWVGTSQNGIFP